MKKRFFLGSGILLAISSIAFALSTPSLLPSSDGNYQTWSLSSGSLHYTNVDDSSCNGSTDYNFTTIVGNRDSYSVNLSSIPNGSKITSISIAPCASKKTNGGSNSTLNVFYRLNNVNSSDAGAYSLSSATPAELTTTNFAGLSVVKSSTTTLEVGAVLSSGTKGAKLSRIYAVVTYSPIDAPTNLSATTTSSSEIDLSWSDTAYEESYAIERKNMSIASSSFSQIATSSANSILYMDSGLTSNTTYQYRIRAFADGAYSAYSSTTESTTLP